MASIQVLVPADPYPPCADTNRDGDPAPKWLREGLLGHSSLVDLMIQLLMIVIQTRFSKLYDPVVT